MPSKLKNISIGEISFVHKGASGDDKHAPKVIFWKGFPMPSFFDRLKGIFSKAEGEGRTPEQMLADLMQQLSPEQQDVLTLILAAAKASPPGAESPAQPAAPKPEAKAGDEMPTEKQEEEMPEEMQKMLDDNPQLAEHFKKIAEARKADRDEIAKLRVDNEERKKRERLETFTKQVQQLTWLPGDHDKVAKALLEVDDKLSEESQETLASLIRTTDGLIKKGAGHLFQEKGTSQPPDDAESIDPEHSIEKLDVAATAKVEEAKKNGEKLTIEKARSMVLVENRQLRKAVNRVTESRM